MSTISLTVPVQPLMINAQSVTSALSATDGTNDRMSFADCLKESNDDSDKEEQTAVTPRSHTSPKRAAAEKGPHHKTSDGASGSLVAGDIAQPQALDPRSMMLSWKKAAAEKSERTTNVATPAGGASTAASGAASAAASAASAKAPIAFTVSIPKEGATATAGQAHGTAGSAAATSGVNANENAPADTGADSSGMNSGNGQGSPDSGDKAPASGGLELIKGNEQPATIAAAAPLNTSITSNAVPAVSAAYSAVDSVKSSAPVAGTAAASAVEEPTAAPVAKPQSIEIRVPGTDGQQVDVRVSQRAGNVDVTVRTPDDHLAQSLRQHLPELSESLSQSGIAGEVLAPTAAAETSSGNNSNPQDDPSNRGWQDQQQNQQQTQQQSDSQQNRRGANWMNEFYNE